jgi:hypothetical protein
MIAAGKQRRARRRTKRRSVVEPPAKAVGVVARAEVVVAGLRIAFFAFESALHSMAKKNRCMQPFTQNVQTFTFL